MHKDLTKTDVTLAAMRMDEAGWLRFQCRIAKSPLMTPKFSRASVRCFF